LTLQTVQPPRVRVALGTVLASVPVPTAAPAPVPTLQTENGATADGGR
jgi:hypothetical protein